MIAATGEVVVAEDTQQRGWRDALHRLAATVAKWRAPVVGMIALIIAWQISSILLPKQLLAGPRQVANAFVHLVPTSAFIGALMFSLRDLYAGLAIGVMAGLILGVAVGSLGFVRGLIGPYITILNPIPNVILLPVFILWFGLGLMSRLMFVTAFAFWPVLLNMIAGVSRSLASYKDLCHVYGLSRWETIRRTMIPAATPYAIAGLRVSAALAAVGMIIAELEVDYTGLGRLLVLYGSNLQMANLEAVVLITALIGLLNVAILKVVVQARFQWIAGLAGADR